jgi:UDPglucose 6-dehydrogenase
MNPFDTTKIGIVGLGFVGSSIQHAFLDQSQTVYVVDKDSTKSTHTIKDLHSCDGIFVCVPTPFGDNGECDTSILESVLEDLKDYTGVIISKCTAPPLTYKRLNEKYRNLVHAPEFLTAANAYRDYVNGEFIIVGGKIKAYVELAAKLISISQPRAKNIAYCTIEEASLTKYTINSFLATKVIFMNEIHALSQKIGSNYDKIAKMVNLDSRIGISHMAVPGPDGQFGFGGACFPKDTAALLKIAEEVNVDMNVLNSAVKKNSIIRLTNS